MPKYLICIKEDGKEMCFSTSNVIEAVKRALPTVNKGHIVTIEFCGD